MLNHKFTAREAGVILLLVAVILGYFYYYVVYQYFEDQIAKYDTSDLDDEITLEQAKLVRLNKMKNELENGEVSDSELGVYNNQSEELLALANILDGKASDISLTWGDPELDGTIVRRDVTVSFNTGNFEEAGEIIKEIADCEYTLLIVDISMKETTIKDEVEIDVTTTPTPTVAVTADENTDAEEGDVDSDTADVAVTQSTTTTQTVTYETSVTAVSLTIRFFETTDGATNLNGLVQPEAEVTIEDDDDMLPSTEELNEEING